MRYNLHHPALLCRPPSLQFCTQCIESQHKAPPRTSAKLVKEGGVCETQSQSSMTSSASSSSLRDENYRSMIHMHFDISQFVKEILLRLWRRRKEQQDKNRCNCRVSRRNWRL